MNDLNKQLVNSFIQNAVDKSWFELLSNTPSLHKAILKLVVLDNYTPGIRDCLNAFKYCKLDNLKVIMLGQDCYPQEGIATGLAFANSVTQGIFITNSSSSEGIISQDGVRDLFIPNWSPSLKIINEELTRTHGELDDPSLISWAEQGILLINSALTCEVNKIGSHYSIWEQFIIDLLKELSKLDLVFVLVGSKAQSFQFCIKGDVIKVKHPAWDIRTGNNGFRGSNCFIKIDEILSKQGKSILWTNKVIV